MERKYLVILAAVVAAIVVAAGLKAAKNPYTKREATMEASLAAIRPTEMKLDQGRQASIDRWKQTIGDKPTVWQELVPEPPPPPPKPPAPPKIEDMIKGLTITRQGIGQKVRVMTPESPKGMFLAVGDTINGVVVKEITKKEVTFSLQWKGQELTYTAARQ